MAQPPIDFYFHVLTGRPSTAVIVAEIQAALVFSGLYDQCRSLTAITVGNGSVKGLMYPRFRVYHAGDDETLYEYPTIRAAWQSSKRYPDGYTIYSHSKGASRDDALGTIWRRLMCHGIFGKWREAVQALNDGSDVAACFFQSVPTMHPAGNWWYAQNHVLSSLPEPTPSEAYPGRLNAEMWLMQNRPTHHELMPDFATFQNQYCSEIYRDFLPDSSIRKNSLSVPQIAGG